MDGCKRFEYAACGRVNFRIRKTIFAEKKISGYVWTWPKKELIYIYNYNKCQLKCLAPAGMKVSLNRFVLKETLNGLRRRNSMS